MSIHPAAAPFSLALRERVAHGPLFDHDTGGIFTKPGTPNCCWVTLAEAEPAAALLVAESDKDDLIARNDHGDYCCRELLIADLLGAAATGTGDGARAGAGS